MILVDTSIWIDYLGAHPGPGASRLDELIAADLPFALTPIILQEILQGARSARDFRRLQKNLLTQHILFPLDPIETFVEAAAMYARCRRAGITPRSAIDCLIAQVAIENRAALLHRDSDFDQIARAVPELLIA